MAIERRKSQKVAIGPVMIGGGEPIVIQTMTNTDTSDVLATTRQIIELVDAGAEIVRIAVNNEMSARAVPYIKEKLLKKKYCAPLIGDFHFNGHLLLSKFPNCARTLDKYRINPGNVDGGKTKGENFSTMIECAVKYEKPVRIGVNWGSVQDVSVEKLVESALESADRARFLGLGADKIVLSVKTSDVQDCISAYELLASKCDYALHVGLTEAGVGEKGVIASSAALAVLLQKGIGDTVRFSLTPGIGKPRTVEVDACKMLLQTMGIRQFRPYLTSCPGCGRTDNVRLQEFANEVDAYIAKKMSQWELVNKNVKNLRVAVMGCAVNGPGEARLADISLSLSGKSEEPIGVVFVHGKPLETIRGENIKSEFLKILDDFARKF